ncbi:MAG: helix-turn-helix transcriptional regulator [Planctomycetota bacterium]|jgi:predicted DNA-binding transcriptional regulator AlpA
MSHTDRETAKTKASEALLVSASTASKLIGVSRSHFYGLHSSGRLGPMPVKLGKRSLWSRQELADWTARRCPARDRWQATDGRAE